MHCLPNSPESLLRADTGTQRLRAWALAGLGLLLALWLLVFPSPAHAETAAITDVRFELTDDAVRMTGNVKFTLSESVKDTLDKGVPVHFMFETNTLRYRWYWSDKEVSSYKRYIRLMYLPLTRKWRVNVSTEPFNRGGVATGVVLNQHYDSLQGALATIQRISSWKVLDREDWSNDSNYSVDVSFKLDVTQLQRPLQIGATGQSDWSLSGQRSFRLTPQSISKPAG